MADHNEALRLADEEASEAWIVGTKQWCAEAATLLRQQAERIAELEAEVQEQARVNGMGAERELALIAERDQHKATATSCLSLLADIRMACGDKGKRMQPELVEFIGAMTTERDQLRAEVERLRVDAERIDYLEYEINELRTLETGEDDYEWVVRSNHMDQPYERDVGRGKTIRAAIDHARTTHKDEG